VFAPARRTHGIDEKHIQDLGRKTGRPRYGWKDNIKNNSYTNWPQNLQSGERLDFRFYLFLLL